VLLDAEGCEQESTGLIKVLGLNRKPRTDFFEGKGTGTMRALLRDGNGREIEICHVIAFNGLGKLKRAIPDTESGG
jgi:hypothetical protein